MSGSELDSNLIEKETPDTHILVAHLRCEGRFTAQ